MDNGEVHKEFDEDDHYIGHASNRLLPSFCVAMDCLEGYVLILRHGDETYAKPVCVAKALSQTHFETSNPHF